ncbi:MAG: hypothetical protein GVY27_05100 [Deinococcus-Thermus bacterium]|jgi:hypothetical protein|nr:hypothetical protein [Deinococcota bacterium]
MSTDRSDTAPTRGADTRHDLRSKKPERARDRSSHRAAAWLYEDLLN